MEITMKVVIEVAPRGSAVRTARAQIAGARRGKSANFHLSFETARSLLADLTPASVDLLNMLLKVGSCTV
jgi:predicted transcriptional regulator